MPEHQMPPAARERAVGGRADRLGVEGLRQSMVERFECAEPVELLAVARGVGTSPRDDVAPVAPVFAHRSDERLPPRERGVQFVPERSRGLPREPSLPIRERQYELVAATLDAGRFLDQPPGGGFLYPQWMPGVTSYRRLR